MYDRVENVWKGGGDVQEQEITALLAERREEGMDALLRHYGPLMRYVISGILQDPRDREECLSEAAMQVWEHIGQFSRQRGSWNAWLTAVARNTALNHARKNARHAGAEELTEHTAAGPSPEEEVVRREREQELLEALGRCRRSGCCFTGNTITCKPPPGSLRSWA